VLAELRGQVSDAEMTISGDPVEVPVDVSHAVSRITRSAAANIKQHASAQRVGLTLTYLPRAILLDIFDDGSGFDQSAVADPSAQGGYGLRAMRQRVAQLGGSFTIETAPGEGTVVAVEIPLHVPAGARS
jgi:signal transduction histidine kinase